MHTITPSNQRTATTAFSKAVLAWFDQHGRKNLPWQQPSSPYRVWVSEIMLQQTQVATVIPYFQRFLARFPDVYTLAAAPEDAVLHTWSGLGYYSRAYNLHQAARIIVRDYGGALPRSVAALAALPGIGKSTAGAIAALSMGIKATILDGNVKRVLTRFQALPGWPNQGTTARQLWAIAEAYTPDARTGDYTQAMMDLGATICTRTRPACTLCPLQQNCLAHQAGTETQFPHAKPRKPLPQRSVMLLMVVNAQGKVLLEKRPASGIWGGLWSFPEVSPELELVEAARQQTGLVLAQWESWAPFRHTFSHYHLDITPVKACIKDPVPVATKNQHWYPLAQSLTLGLAAPIKKLLDQLQQHCHWLH